MEIDYSVVIRTTGKAGEKYEKLLDSISHLVPKPKEVIVVLPEGYVPPKETLGWETIVFCAKGMVRQRLKGLEVCKTKYALFTDDDISFQADFCEKLYNAIKDKKFGFSIGPLTSFFPQAKKQIVLSAIMGTAVPTVFHKGNYNTVLRTTGYSYNAKINIDKECFYETQSAPWTCFFADIEKMKSIHFEKELWLDMHGYSAHDDTTMFYKAWLYGIKTVMVSDASYEHLDARTSTKGNSEKVSFAVGFNTYVFWKRFIYAQQKNVFEKIWSKICIWYRFSTQRLYNKLRVLRHQISKSDEVAFNNGYNEARVWVDSDEYMKLSNKKL